MTGGGAEGVHSRQTKQPLLSCPLWVVEGRTLARKRHWLECHTESVTKGEAKVGRMGAVIRRAGRREGHRWEKRRPAIVESELRATLLRRTR